MTLYRPVQLTLFVAIFPQNFFVIYSLFDRNLVLLRIQIFHQIIYIFKRF